MVEQLANVTLYTPDLDRAQVFYAALSLILERERPLERGRRMIEFRFRQGGAKLVLHDDEHLQFTDVEFEVADVREAYRRLSRDPGVAWLREPIRTSHGWTATIRGRDRNVIVLSSPESPPEASR